ncbi:predicted protein [Plenodomus lingam JN3]|uniref:Predicted protein n=1 Tax=Leptosphaeria maculans (strain JN3 / isolate v23.1.3 / race Av1-4-5-6-7-8) TaxID=985895 RepID=E5ACQ7_LEPMJ|nr:predicted protein [Plenodomus lingam JN3]CBY02259.1 predicted protein [Plenodomus lingam JN3]
MILHTSRNLKASKPLTEDKKRAFKKSKLLCIEANTLPSSSAHGRRGLSGFQRTAVLYRTTILQAFTGL